jgi:hypothetical protein
MIMLGESDIVSVVEMMIQSIRSVVCLCLSKLCRRFRGEGALSMRRKKCKLELECSEDPGACREFSAKRKDFRHLSLVNSPIPLDKVTLIRCS